LISELQENIRYTVRLSKSIYRTEYQSHSKTFQINIQNKKQHLIQENEFPGFKSVKQWYQKTTITPILLRTDSVNYNDDITVPEKHQKNKRSIIRKEQLIAQVIENMISIQEERKRDQEHKVYTG